MLIDDSNNNSKKDPLIDNQFDGMYTNNPDDKMYTNNPDEDKIIINPKIEKNKPFFNDDDNEDDNNPYLDKKEKKIIKNGLNNVLVDNYNNIDNKMVKNEKMINDNKNEIELKEIDIDKKEQNEEIIEENDKLLINKDKNILDNGNIIIEEDNKIKKQEKINPKSDNKLEKNNKKKEEKKSQSESLISSNNSETILNHINNNNINNNSDEQSCLKHSNIKTVLLSIIFGQMLALLSVGNGYFVKEIQNNINTPLLINSCFYFLLFLIYFFISKCKIRKPKWIYLILSIFDSQANFVNVYVFSFIDFKFPFIINVLCTVWVVIFTLILIRTYRYLMNHLIGIILFIVGVCATFIGTFDEDKFNEFKNIFTSFNKDLGGLLLCLLVSILYGLNSVLLEKYISTENEEIISYCTWLGIFGFFISLLEAFIPKKSEDGMEMEYKILYSTKSDNLDKTVIIYWILSAIFLAAMTSLAPYYIQKYQATMYNISLVFTVFWSFIIDIIQTIILTGSYEFAYLQILYFVGFIIIIIGTIIFFKRDRVRRHDFNYS